MITIYYATAVFAFIGALGLLRFPDVYTRIHAATLITISGLVIPLFALAYAAPEFRLRIIAIAIIMLVTNATTGHAIGRAAYRHGIAPKNLSKNDLGRLK